MGDGRHEEPRNAPHCSDVGHNALPNELFVILDLAPPFHFLAGEGEFSRFLSVVRKHGVKEVPASALAEAGIKLFRDIPNTQPVRIATRASIKKAEGDLDPYMTGGFVEDAVPEHLAEPNFMRRIADCCEARTVDYPTANGTASFWALSCAEATHAQMAGLLSDDTGRFLDAETKIKRLLRGLSIAANIRIPTGQDRSNEEVVVSVPKGLLERTQALDQREVTDLKIDKSRSGAQAALVIGLDRRAGREPIAFVPLEVAVPDRGRPILQFPLRSTAFLLRCRALEEASRDGFVRTMSLDLHIPRTAPWTVALQHVYGRMADAIAQLQGAERQSVQEIAFRDDRSLKTLLCWIEMPRGSEPPSSSLDELDKLSTRFDPVASAPGLTPLVERAQVITDRISSAGRLTHADPEYPLDPYQSRAAAGIASLGDLWAQAVTGPPGTGKTSMMRAVISDRVVRDLIEDRAPSLLLAGPTTQAYQNLLGAMSFEWGGAPRGGRRVFEDFPHVGAVIPTRTELSTPKSQGGRRESEDQARDPVVPHLRFVQASGVPQELRPCFDQLELPCGAGVVIGDRPTLRFVESLLPSSARDMPFSKSQIATEVAATLAILSAIRETIATIVKRAETDGESGLPRVAWPDTIAEYEPLFSSVFHRLRVEKPREPRHVIVDEALDLSIRHFAFHVGWRLGQLRYVEAAHRCRAEIPHIEERWRKAPDKQRYWIGREVLSEVKAALAFLLPIRTCTVTSAGRKSEEQFGGPAQMVVVDEAGMMSPEFVPPIMAEGRRTLAVGDPYQIAPVGSDALPVFAAVLADAGLDGFDMECWTQTDRTDPNGGPDLKGGNGMSVVETLSPYRGAHALVLQRHYRCPASIIEISNDLVYRPRGIALEPMVPDPVISMQELPIIGCVLHSHDPPKGQTFNIVEAEAVVAAFFANYQQILAKAKGAPGSHEITLEAHLELMAEAVAFISPYRDQARRDRLPEWLRASVARKFSDADLDPDEVVYLGILPNLMRRALLKRLPGEVRRVEAVMGATVFGTIHALQGAEKPVVFMSCVAGTHTGFFNREAALINVGVTRAKSNLIIARGLAFGSSDPEGSAARHIAETTAGTRVLMPDTVVLVESEAKGVPITMGSPRFQVIATRGSIGRVASLDRAGRPIVEILPSTDKVAGDLALAQRWLRPRGEGGFGLKRLLIATDADDEGSVIAHDLMAYLGLDGDRITTLGITVRRWRLEDAAGLGSGLVESLDTAPIFAADVTEMWAAHRQRARSELRSAASRAMMAEVRKRVKGRPPSPPALRAMAWLGSLEKKAGPQLRVELRDEAGSVFSVLASEAPGVPKRFASRSDAERALTRLRAEADLKLEETVILSPIRTKRSLFDVLGVLTWAGISPSEGMEVLQRIFERAARRK